MSPSSRRYNLHLFTFCHCPVSIPIHVVWNLSRQVVEEFKLHAREKKFVVREFTYNEEEMAAGKNEITKLVTDKKKQFVSQTYSILLSEW